MSTFKIPVFAEIGNRAAVMGRRSATAFRVLRTAESILDVAVEHLTNTRLTPAAQREDALTAVAKKGLVKRFNLAVEGAKRDRAVIGTARTDLEARAFPENQYGPEIRTAARGMSQAEMVTAAASDLRVLAAIWSAPTMLHGVSREPISHLIERHLQQNHPAELAEIEAAKEAADASAAAVEAATASVREALGMRPREFSDFLERFAPSKTDLEVEAKGGVAPGMPTHSMLTSMELINSDALQGLPA
jgi:hypothetical protein